MSSYLVQGSHGTRGNFEVVVPSSHGGGLVHLWRNNDAGMVWNGPTCFGTARYVESCLIQSNYGSPGNLEVLAVDDAGNLDFFWRIDRSPWTWSGPHRITAGVRGAPSLIQSRHGRRGNFEAVVPHREGGLVHLWRNNDAGMVWSPPFRFGGRARYVGASLIQSNYGSPGNLEVLAVDDAGNLDFFWRIDRSPWTWSGPHRVAGGLRGAPSLIQSRHGTRGNFEAVAPHRDGGLVHLWRNNDAGMVWSSPSRFGGSERYRSTALIQSSYGTTGNLEALALDDTGTLDFFWRIDRSPWTWSGPSRPGVEISSTVSECVYGWRSAYHQADTHVTVRIQLNPDAGITDTTMTALRTTWRDGIIAKWSNRFDCRAVDGGQRRITFDVRWVTSDAHHVVRVQQGPARSNVTTWDTSDSGDVASHEFGHMLGHPDEYADSACPSRTPVSTGTVMDDNTETVERLYSRIATAHCNHRPTAPVTAGAVTTIEGVRLRVRDIDRLQPEHRGEVLGHLRAFGDPGHARDEGAGDAEVSFEVSGGAPGERYLYRVSVKADGTAERHLLDEFQEPAPQERAGRVDDALAARVFGAAEEVGLFADEAPSLGVVGLPPDTLVATITVRDGENVRSVTVPASEPGRTLPPAGARGLEHMPGEPAAIPLDTHLEVPRVSAEMLQPVLAALHEVESAL